MVAGTAMIASGHVPERAIPPGPVVKGLLQDAIKKNGERTATTDMPTERTEMIATGIWNETPSSKIPDDGEMTGKETNA